MQIHMMQRVRQQVARVACLLLVVCLAAMPLVSCAAKSNSKEVVEESSSGKQVEPAEQTSGAKGTVSDESLDAMTEYAVYLVGKDDGCAEYQIFVCGYDTRKLLAMADETVFFKSAGYGERLLRDLDFDAIWPNVSELDFVSTGVLDHDDYLLAYTWFDDLDDPDNLQALADSGILGLESQAPDVPLDADELMRLTVERGGKLLSEDDKAYAYLELDAGIL